MIAVGKYELIRNEQYEEYLKAVDAGYLFRKLTMRARYNVDIELEGDAYTITTVCLSSKPVPPHVIKFKLNEEFHEETSDGRQCKTLSTIKDGKVVQTQNCAHGNSIIEHDFQGNKWIVTLKVKEVVCTRTYYKRRQE